MKIDEVKRNVFYQFPQWLLEEEYKEMSLRAKIIYMLIFDRRTLSVKNNWHDQNGEVYVYFTIEEFMEKLSCSRQSVINAKKELQDYGLIKEDQQGMNRPNRIYINGSLKNRLQEVQNLDSGSLKNRLQEVQNLDGIKTNNINTNYTNTDNNNRSTVGGGNTLYSKAKKMSQEPTTTANELEIFNDLLFENFGSYPSPLQIDDMRYMLEEHSLEVIKLAIKECVDYAKPNMSYMRTVLRNWKKAGLNTPELVKNRVKPRSTRGKVTMLDDGYDPKLGI
jgi:DnaD/phage-associated family protein